MPIYSNVMAKDDTLKGLSDTSIVLICTVVTSENLWKMNVIFIKATNSAMKKLPYKRDGLLGGYKLVIFYYLNAS
jgi:hypothetical protein